MRMPSKALAHSPSVDPGGSRPLRRSLQELDESIAAAQQDHQNWALRVFETTRGRQNLQMGDLEEASVDLEGRFALDEAHLIAGTLHAPAVWLLAS